MKSGSLGVTLAVLTSMGAACAHAPAPAGREGKAPAAEKVFVTGSHIRQRVDPATGAVPTTASPLRIYSRYLLAGTGRQADLSAALRALDASVSP
ncbi:MAG: hypothetical protein ACXWLR_00775 [Myxococcales bacterium]